MENDEIKTEQAVAHHGLVRCLEVFMCGIGMHKWGEEYQDAGQQWCFGMGHSAQDCTRPGCDYTLRKFPT